MLLVNDEVLVDVREGLLFSEDVVVQHSELDTIHGICLGDQGGGHQLDYFHLDFTFLQIANEDENAIHGLVPQFQELTHELVSLAGINYELNSISVIFMSGWGTFT